MERKALWQGLWIIALGVFFLILIFVLHDLSYIKSDRLIIYYVPSAILVALGVVAVVVSRRTPQGPSVKNQGQKA